MENPMPEGWVYIFVQGICGLSKRVWRWPIGEDNVPLDILKGTTFTIGLPMSTRGVHRNIFTNDEVISVTCRLVWI